MFHIDKSRGCGVLFDMLMDEYDGIIGCKATASLPGCASGRQGEILSESFSIKCIAGQVKNSRADVVGIRSQAV